MPAKSNLYEFIQKANKVHNSFYDYSKTEYINSATKIEVTCPIHGNFTITPNNHISKKSGCSKCGHNIKTLDYYLDRMKSVHKNRYVYDKVKINNGSKSVIKVGCKQHGYFKTRLDSHISGFNCPKCGKIAMIRKKRRKRDSCWAYTDWENNGLTSKYFESFKLYVYKLWNEEEEFYKVGKTFRKINSRYTPSNMPYKYKLLKIIEGTALEMSEKEYGLLIKNERYRPKIKFEGYTECLKNNPFE